MRKNIKSLTTFSLHLCVFRSIFTLHNIMDLFRSILSVFNHNITEFFKRKHTISICIILGQFFCCLFICSLSLSKINQNIFEFFFVHCSIMIQIIVFESFDKRCSFLRCQDLLLILVKLKLKFFFFHGFLVVFWLDKINIFKIN